MKTLLWFSAALAATSAFEFPSFQRSYGSNASEHRRYGAEAGAAFRDAIGRRLDAGNIRDVAAWLAGDGAAVYGRLAARRPRGKPRTAPARRDGRGRCVGDAW